MLEFKKIELEDRQLLREILKNKYENSELNFTNLYMWADCFNTQYALCEGNAVIINVAPDGRYLCFFPGGGSHRAGVLKEMYAYLKSINQPFIVTNATEEEARLFGEVFPGAEIGENRSFEDYVYLASSLISLSGKKLHGKKNHLNRFVKLYEGYVYREIRREDFSQCMSLAERLISAHSTEGDIDSNAELASIGKLFGSYEELGLRGGVIEIDGRIAAFTVGEACTESYALIHIEKADTAYDGIYAAINNEFAKNVWSDFEFINREEDMGLPGLRKAKLSYRPHHMVQKFRCSIC